MTPRGLIMCDAWRMDFIASVPTLDIGDVSREVGPPAVWVRVPWDVWIPTAAAADNDNRGEAA